MDPFLMLTLGDPMMLGRQVALSSHMGGRASATWSTDQVGKPCTTLCTCAFNSPPPSNMGNHLTYKHILHHYVCERESKEGMLENPLTWP